METLQTRTDSFSKTKRVKNPSKPSSYVTLKWPHPSNFKANADTLAEAGFFYDPSYDDPDNVTCYVCGKELSGWETEDDPFDIHWEKCGQRCCWASVRCGLRGDMDRYGRFTFPDKTRLPASKAMEKARQETFSAGEGWIHDRVKNHGANSKKMARAGFVCTPQHVGDDLATCMYCHISLSGWDEEDDPMEEHRKRMKPGQTCPMFLNTPSDPAITTKPPSRSQSAKPPSKSHSRTTSRSKATTHQDILMPTKTHDGDPDAESDSESAAASTRNSAKTPRKGRSTSGSRKSSAKTTARSKTRSTSRSGLRNVMEDEETEAEEATPAPPPTVKKKARSRSKSVARNVTEDEETEAEETIPAPPPTVKKKVRSRSKSVARNVTEDEGTGVEETIPAPPPTVKKNARSGSKSIARSEAPDQTETGDHDELVPRKTSSRTKAKVKATLTEDTEDEVPRKSSRSKSKPPPPPAEAVGDTGPRKPSRTKSKIKIFDDEEVAVAERKSRPVSKAKPASSRELSHSKATPAVTAVLEEEYSELEQSEIIVKPSKKASSSIKSKPKPKGQVPAANLFADDDDVGGYVPSKVASTVELPPLFVPKRGEKGKTVSVEPETGVTRPVEKEKKKPGRPPKSKAKPPSSTRVTSVEEEGDLVPIEEYHAPLSPASNNAPQSTAREKALGSKAGGKQDEGRTVVVELSTEEEGEKEIEDAKKAKRINLGVEGKENARISKQVPPPPEVIVVPTKKEKKQEQLPAAPVVLVSSKPAEAEDEDVQMHSAEAESLERQDTAPQTPPRGIVQALPTTTVLPPPQKNNTVASDEEPIFMPALSKLPFTPLQALTEAELDMSVEEWIRYQMEVEYDKFKRDGERELSRFKKRAEDVRKIIDGL